MLLLLILVISLLFLPCQHRALIKGIVETSGTHRESSIKPWKTEHG
jgi:hypothetical protein